MASVLPDLGTTNTDLAAALMSVGISLDPVIPVRKLTGDGGGERVTWFFLEQSPCGLYQTRHLMLIWDDLTWHDRNPDHPFAYLKVMVTNRKRMLDALHRRVPLCVTQKGSKFLLLPLNAPDALQQTAFKEFNKR